MGVTSPSSHEGCEPTAPRRALSRPARAGLLLVLVYVYVWLAVDPRLCYHAQCPIFRTDSDFAAGTLLTAAGPAEYVAALACQSYPWAWAGAVVVTAAIAGVCLTGGAYLAAIAGRPVRWVHLAIAAPLLALHSLYGYPLLASVALLAALAAAAGYARLGWKNPAWRLAAFVVVSAGVYWAAGGAYLLFALLCGLAEVLAARRWLAGAVCLLVGAALPWAASIWPFRVPAAEAYTAALGFTQQGTRVLSVVLYSLLPLAAAGVACRSRLGGLAGRLAERLTARCPALDRLVRPGAARRAAATAALLVLVVGGAWCWLDRGKRKQLRLDYLARQRDWPALLAEARAMPLDWVTSQTVHNVDLALFHSGRMGDEMFHYAQKRGIDGLMLHWDTYPGDGLNCLKLSDLMFDLGHVNEAEHAACEALEMLGERPHVLKRLAWVYALKRMPAASRTFLTALRRNLLHRAEARRRLAELREDPSLASVSEVARTRARMPTKDFSGFVSTERVLLQLLTAHPDNRMAGAYLAAHYLLNVQLPEFVDLQDRLSALRARPGGGEADALPRHYQQALVLYEHIARRRLPRYDRLIEPQTRTGLAEFLAVRERFGHDEAGAEKALNAGFGGTYYFYYAFGKTQGGAR